MSRKQNIPIEPHSQSVNHLLVNRRVLPWCIHLRECVPYHNLLTSTLCSSLHFFFRKTLLNKQHAQLFIGPVTTSSMLNYLILQLLPLDVQEVGLHHPLLNYFVSSSVYIEVYHPLREESLSTLHESISNS